MGLKYYYKKNENYLIYLAFLVILYFCVTMVGEEYSFRIDNSATLGLGFILFVGYFLSAITNKYGFPNITGYLLAGIVFGPSFLYFLGIDFSFITRPILNELELIVEFALGLIAFTAGGELKFSEFKKKFTRIFFITVFQAFTTFVCVSTMAYFAVHWIISAGQFSEGFKIALAICFGVIATATSPAIVIAIFKEYRSQGNLTNTILGITILKDIVVLFFFAIVLSISKSLVQPEHVFNGSFFVKILWEMAGSVIAGIIIGGLLVFYLKKINAELTILIPGTAFLIMYISPKFHISGLIVCIIAGTLIVNYSNQGNVLFKAIDKTSLPIFVIFFFITGAKINFSILIENWGFVVGIVLVRFFSNYVGTTIPSLILKEEKKISQYAWSGSIGQAGIEIGFVLIIVRAIPGLGNILQPIIFSMIALNLFAGPITLAWGLKKSGESKVN